ncbi:F-type H+-transporting ATPase subunit delta [Arthrobacter silviterrae]|uniref:ATP synthase subunit delta n=1 Tax=Arthrobacter silviterrae TaxID=2026658 RepID=A0ABX0DEX0_9MICC|nr:MULTISPECIES: F0F1 ATP synthase subunit delta [Arthrobacter]MCU6480669.1 F0F1 ATP synthase subunit delta [Arthrobacter sp. A2-55]MDQ0276953.1 F-type H+-transporting ATPase subunit delta [Arthrobacter silviterrae]NGN82742.1 F0F1 ATP synthase subunit delta [Arthrobacter silviterrae]
MAGVSSESLTTALGQLEASLPTASLSLAQELFSILAVLDSSAGLRRSLTDPSRTGAEKSALVSSLVKGKVSAEAEAIVGRLAAARWSDARDLGDALETVAATVVIAVAENRNTSASSGNSVSGLGGLASLESELFSFSQAVDSSHEVQRALVEPQASESAKLDLAIKLVPGASGEAQALIRQAVVNPRGLKTVKLIERFANLAAARQQRWIAEVTVSRPMQDGQLARLQRGLNSLYGRELNINVRVDPALIGGVRVRVGDEVVDASVMARLGELRRQLAG